MSWGCQPVSFVNAAVVAADGRIAASLRVRGSVVDRLGGSPERGDVVIDLEEAVVVPGLINAHDHLELNSFGRLRWREHYGNVRGWIADFQPRFHADPQMAAARRDTHADRVWVGGLKNLLSGVTTVCHHDPRHRVLNARFPVRVVRRMGMSHSLQIDGARVAAAYRRTPPTWPWVVHAAEGIDAEAANEIATLEAMGCLGANTVLVHGVAIADAADQVLARGAALVWCPSSNQFLFGRTAAVDRFAARGKLAIGTDSRLSGAGDLLDEVRAARETGQIGAESIVRAVTGQAAEILRLSRAGRLVPGLPADLAVFRRVATDPWESLVQARRTDLRLAMRDGVPLVGDAALAPVFRAARVPFAAARVDGQPRLLARWIAGRAARLRVPEPGLEVAES